MSLAISSSQKKRYPSQVMVSGLRQIPGGVFGGPAHTPTQEMIEELSAVQGVYHYHEGEIFLPGPPSWCLDPSHETQLMTVWGHAFLNARPNTFPPISYNTVVWAQPVQPLIGLGGQVAGQMFMQPIQLRGVST